MTVSFDIELKGMDKVLAALSPKTYEKALRHTMTETRRSAVTALSKAIRHEYAIKAKDAKAGMRVWSDGASVFLRLSGKPLSFKRFDTSQTKKGVTVKIRKDRKRKLVRGAFIQQSLGGHVFARQMKYRRDASKEEKKLMRRRLKKFYTLSLAQMANENTVRRTIREVTSKFDERFRRNFDYYLSKL